MESSLYYTFSTIAQTLAAAIALLAAFTLYRLQSLAKILEETSREVTQAYMGEDHTRLTELRIASNYDAFVTYLASAHSEHADKVPFAERRRTFDNAWRSVQQVRRLLNWSLVSTLCVVVSSIAILAAVPRLAQLATAVWILRGGILGTAVCLVVYTRLVRAAVA